MKKRHLNALHRLCRNHRQEVSSSEMSGCFYCCKTFLSVLVNEWVDKDGDTAVCPLCRIDSVLPGNLVVLSPRLLKEMNEKFFGIHPDDGHMDLLSGIRSKMTPEENKLVRLEFREED